MTFSTADQRRLQFRITIIGYATDENYRCTAVSYTHLDVYKRQPNIEELFNKCQGAK